jgi:hypothetical protein
MNLNLEFKNFKKIKDFSHEFQSGNVYVVGGPNNIGKTTFLQGLSTLATGIARKTDNVSFGEENGQVKGQFSFDGANGGNYLVKWDFTSDTNKFVIIDPDTNVHKSTSRNNVIADIFKYNSFTIDEWFGWGLTAEGRKKQAEIILNLLPDIAREEYLKIENEVSPKFGTLYGSRTIINKEYEAAKSIVDQFKLTPEEKEKITKVETAKNLLYTYEQQLEKILANNPTKLSENLKTTKDAILQNNLFIDSAKEDIDDITQQIKSLEEKKVKRLSELKGFENIMPDLKDKNIKALEDVNNCKDLGNEFEVRERITSGKAFIEAVRNIEAKDKSYTENKKVAQVKFDELQILDADIKKKRERKEAIIEENKLPVENISIEDGECFYVDGNNYIPFTKDSVSYSEGGMIIIKLMAHLNQALPIWLIGSAESYDNTRLPELLNIAKQYNGIIFMDRVIADSEQELSINILES